MSQLAKLTISVCLYAQIAAAQERESGQDSANSRDRMLSVSHTVLTERLIVLDETIAGLENDLAAARLLQAESTHFVLGDVAPIAKKQEELIKSLEKLPVPPDQQAGIDEVKTLIDDLKLTIDAKAKSLSADAVRVKAAFQISIEHTETASSTSGDAKVGGFASARGAQLAGYSHVISNVSFPTVDEEVDALRNLLKAPVDVDEVAQAKKRISEIIDKLKSDFADIASQIEMHLKNSASFFQEQLRQANESRKAIVVQIKQVEHSFEGSYRNLRDIALLTTILGLLCILPVLFLLLKRLDPRIQFRLVKSRMFLEIVATTFLVLTILILGVGKSLNPESLGTLLGTLAGYLLGRQMSANQKVPKRIPTVSTDQAGTTAQSPTPIN